MSGRARFAQRVARRAEHPAGPLELLARRRVFAGAKEDAPEAAARFRFHGRLSPGRGRRFLETLARGRIFVTREQREAFAHQLGGRNGRGRLSGGAPGKEK